jgi:hypothetical protein
VIIELTCTRGGEGGRTDWLGELDDFELELLPMQEPLARNPRDELQHHEMQLTVAPA